jgi:uncharacterized protein involved in exopolysaccharide biosynthesis
MERQVIDPEERVFTLSDVKRLYMAQRRRLMKWALLGAILTFLLLGIRSPKYKITATFKEGVEKAEGSGALKELMGLASSSQPQAASFMRSFQVLKPLVQKMGLQVSPTRAGWIAPKVWKRYCDNLRATKEMPLADLDPFRFEDVIYEGEKTVCFGIKFINPDHFIIQSSDQKSEMGRGVLGAEVHLPEFQVQFTLVKAPSSLKTGTVYPFTIGNWIKAAQSIRDDLQIVANKSNKSIYDLAFFSRDRHLGQCLLNELMHQYQCYLKREHDALAEEQLTYLEGKQEQLYGKLDLLLKENVDYLAKNIEESGFVSFDREGESLLFPYQEMQQKSLAIDVELARLAEIEKEGRPISCMANGPCPNGTQQILQKIQELKQERDLLELSLGPFSEQSLAMRRDDLKEIRNQRLAVEKLIQEVERGGEISSCDLNRGLCLWAASVEDPEEREDFAEYLENYAHLLSVREKMLQERFFSGEQVSSELEGIDLNTARQLFVEYNTKLDTALASMRYYEHLKKGIYLPHFELSSLSSVLIDPLSKQLIAEASQASLRLKEEKYCSSKEGERCAEQLALHKRILSDHLEQLFKVEELNATAIREKMASLQNIRLDCINQQLSVLREQARGTAKEQQKALTQEKKLLEKKMRELRILAAPLAEKWRLGQWLGIKTGIVTKMMQAITEIVESKTISHQLHHVESKPLDTAILPPFPENPHLYLMSFLGAFCFAFGSFFLSFIRQILKGFPTTLEKLQALRLPVLGSLSAFCDGPSVETPNGSDLEALRRLALFAKGGKVIGLLGGRGPDYSFALGENLARTSIKSIVLRCDFLSKFRKEDGPGLLQIWKGEVGELPIRKGKGFDYITAGGYTPFGTEILQSQRFAQLIEMLKKNYDHIFLLCRTPLSSAESTAALHLCDQAVVTVSGEQTEELTPFISWAYDEDRCRLTFMTQA